MCRKLILMLACLTLISGCGFKLKGDFDLSSRFPEISIAGGELLLVNRLTILLTRAGTSVVTDEADSITIRILRSELSKEVNTTNTEGIATGYRYHQVVEYTVIGKDGSTLLTRSTINQHRTLEYTQGNELELEEEEGLIRQEINTEIASQIIRQLAQI